MAITEEQYAELEKNRKDLMDSQWGQHDQPTLASEHISLFALDCHDRIIGETGYRDISYLYRPGAWKVRSDCTKRVRLYLRYKQNRMFRYPFVKVFSVTLQAVYSKGYATFRWSGGTPNAFSGILRKARTRVPYNNYMYGSNRPMGSKNRPSPEWFLGTVRSAHWGDFVVPTTGLTNYYALWRTWTGTTTPGFKLYKNRQLPVNPHTVELDWSQPPREYEHTYNAWSDSHDYRFQLFMNRAPSYWTAITPPHESTGDLYNKAVKRLIDKAGNQITGNLAQDITQINQTLRVFATTAGRLVHSVTALRKGNIPGAVKALWTGKKPRFRRGGGPKPGATLASNWLELQYGWKPLLQDIEGSMQALSQLAPGIGDFVSAATASAHRTTHTRTDLYWDTYAGFLGQTPVGFETDNVKDSVRVGIRYKIGNSTSVFLAQTGFTNPLNLAWEVLPFSFVLDWFIPIGPYLESLSAWDGLTFVDGFKTQFTRRRRLGRTHWSGQVGTSGPGTSKEHWITGDKYGSAYGEAIRLTRTKLTSFPGLVYPNFKSPFSTTHALNALALVRVAFKTPYH